MKPADPMKVEEEAIGGLSGLLRDVPHAHVTDVHYPPPDGGVDFVVDVEVGQAPYRLLCEVKSSGSPSNARKAINQLITYQTRERAEHGARPEAVGLMFVAPYLTPQVRQLCRDYDVNYYDLMGNCRIALPGLYIDHTVAETPPAERRDLKSLFRPKSARVLRFLLREPERARRLNELSERTGVSLGQVHKLKTALLERDWIAETPDGVRLENPGALLDAWRADYIRPAGERRGYYTTLHGTRLDQAVEAAVRAAEGGAAFSGRSAANWLAPWLIANMTELYVDADRLEALISGLELQPAESGANVRITALEDDGPLLDAGRTEGGLWVTSPVQTYLDLSRGGERDREAAKHLRSELLGW